MELYSRINSKCVTYGLASYGHGFLRGCLSLDAARPRSPGHCTIGVRILLFFPLDQWQVELLEIGGRKVKSLNIDGGP